MDFEDLRAALADAPAAREAGITAVEATSPAGLRVEVETVPGRSHAVWVAHERDGQGDIARLVAPLSRIPKGRSLAPGAAAALLRRNATTILCSLALVTLDGDEHVALVAPLRLETQDTVSCLLALVRLASAADGFEESLGVDEL